MPDAESYARIVQLDIRVVKPFLAGTKFVEEDAIVNELLTLKPLVESFGIDESEKVIRKLEKEGKHDEIVPFLQKKQKPAKSSKGGVFGWLFKDKEKEKKERSGSSHEEKKTSSKEVPSEKQKSKKDNQIDSTSESKSMKVTPPPLAREVAARKRDVDLRLQAERTEAELRSHCKFDSDTKREENKDELFESIFNEFLKEKGTQ